MAGMGQQGTNAMAALLGGGGNMTAQNQAFDNFRNNTGYQFNMDQGQQAITGSNAAKGILNSGAAAKSLMKFGTGLADNTYNNYFNQNKDLANMGLQAGQLLGSVGQESNSQAQSTSSTRSQNKSTQSGGKKGLLDYGAAALGGIAASDRRLKTNISAIGKMENGLNIYRFDYINGSGPHVGVMADEVATMVPEALGPMIGGFMTVDYSKIGE